MFEWSTVIVWCLHVFYGNLRQNLHHKHLHSRVTPRKQRQYTWKRVDTSESWHTSVSCFGRVTFKVVVLLNVMKNFKYTCIVSPMLEDWKSCMLIIRTDWRKICKAGKLNLVSFSLSWKGSLSNPLDFVTNSFAVFGQIVSHFM